MLLGDSDLDPCRGDRLDAVIAGGASQPTPTAECLTSSAPQAGRVLLALHGGGECVTADDDPWRAAVAAGRSVHRPISTQRLAAGLATWSNLDLAVEECVEQARRIGRVDSIAGYSLGACVAVRLNAEGVDAPLLLVAPSLREQFIEQVRSMGVSAARLAIVTGERDPYLESTRAAADALSKAGTEVELQIVANLGHVFPVDFDRWLVSTPAAA